MNKPPALQFYVKDYLASPTRRLFCPRARLAYLELLFYCWDGEATLPNDSETLRKLAECSVPEWKEFGAEIIAKFTVNREGMLTHEKQQNQWRELKAYRRKQIENGRKGGRPKAVGYSGLTQEKPTPSSASASAFASASAIKSNTHTNGASAPQGFLLFLDSYPKDHIGVKSEAMRAWMEIPSAEIHMGEILNGLERWISSDRWTDEGGRYVPSAVRFLRAKQWRSNPPMGEGRKRNAGPDISLTFSKTGTNR